MGRGGYFGGSTIIRPGSDWFAYSEPKRKTGKKAKEASKPNVPALRLIYLNGIIDSLLSGAPLPKSPRKLRVLLEEDVAKAGGPVAWARAQSEFSSLLKKKRKRLDKRASRQSPVNSKVEAEGAALSVSQTRLAELRTERTRLLIGLQEAEKLVSQCKSAIVKIDQEIAALNA